MDEYVELEMTYKKLLLKLIKDSKISPEKESV